MKGMYLNHPLNQKPVTPINVKKEIAMIKHIENDQARVDLDTGGYLLFDGDTQHLLVNGETELSSEDENDTLFKIKGEIYFAWMITEYILADWDAVLAEQAEADEAAHIERYSSVEGSGRI